MIKNERQYRITKAQAEKFAQALAQFKKDTDKGEQMHPLLRQAQIDALQSQFEDLHAQIEEYEALKAGRYKIIELDSFEELPLALIQARIASGLSQKELADKLGIKEQQIQRYEATDYASASFERIKEVIDALGIKVQENVLLPNNHISWNTIVKKLKNVGVDNDFLIRRIIPPSLLESLQENTERENYSSILKAASIVGRIFDWSLTSVLDISPLQLNVSTIEATRFKKSINANERRTSAYTVYAHFLALLVLESTSALPRKPVPPNTLDVRNAILSNYGSLNLKNVLNYIWDLGIPVLPLNDQGTFQGACWRVDKRNVIVLKQKTMSEAWWLFDLLHELGHAKQDPDQDEFNIVESGMIGQGYKQTREELDASSFAGNVLLANRAEELTDMCVKSANGSIERLKAVVPRIAKQENFPTDVLANYIAFRLSLQKEDWWATAQNLQTPSTVHWGIAREILLERVNLDKLNEIDRDLLMRALSSPEV